MTNLLLIGISLLTLLSLSYIGAGAQVSALIFGVITLVALFSSASWLLAIPLVVISLILLVFAVPALRINLVSAPALKLIRTLLPPISDTEREAIDAGTVWWDGELFAGKPNWDKLLSAPVPTLTTEEQAFIDGPVNELNRMSDAWKINHDWNVIPDHIIKYVCDKGFLGMIIPKQYGGLEFTPVAQAQILLNLTNTGGGISYLVGVPNSLGPGELLIKYGTEDQKDYYLPRLANGKEIPCFALTGPTVGSDATSLPDTGIVCKGQWEGKEVLGMKLTFSKRYITLAPIATLIGLAFRLQDPDGLIGDIDDYGITCALIPRSTPGLEIGRRHLPIGEMFLNGPLEGTDVFVPLDSIIGGLEMAGKGWRMLVNCLSVGRAVTLPTTAAAAAKRTLMGTSAYANLRKQFGVAIVKFEGIQKPLARMAGLAYIIDAARLQTIQSIVDGNKPSVPSAILKYHCTEMARQCLLDAMDIHGGKAVVKGPGNYIASLYESIPVAITVEGANILTRNLMIFGQGAIRSHPYILKEMELAHAEDNQETLNAYDQTLTAHFGFGLRNFSRSLVLGLGLPWGDSPSGDPEIDRYYRHINRLSSVFALTADFSMASIGARLKFKEMISARLGDLLSMLYLSSMVLKHHKDSDYHMDERPVVKWALDHCLHEYQIAFDELMTNYPNRLIATVLKTVAFPLGHKFKAPVDNLEKQVVNMVSEDGFGRQRLTDGAFMELSENNPLAGVNQVFLNGLKLKTLHKKLKQAIKDKLLPGLEGNELIDAALSKHMINKNEAEQLAEFELQLTSIINVDDFDESELIRVPYSDKDDTWRKVS